MKTENFDTGLRYELAYRQVWANLAEWKRIAIEDELSNMKKDSRLYQEFINEVIVLAENPEAEIGVYKKVELPVSTVKTSSVKVGK